MLSRFANKAEVAKQIVDFFDKRAQAQLQLQQPAAPAEVELKASAKPAAAPVAAPAAPSASASVQTPSPVLIDPAVAQAVAPLASKLALPAEVTGADVSQSPETRSVAPAAGLAASTTGEEGGGIILKEMSAGKSSVVERLAAEGTFCSEDTRLEGWLSKQAKVTGVSKLTLTNPNAAWKRRYFVLKRGCLWYYEMTPKVP